MTDEWIDVSTLPDHNDKVLVCLHPDGVVTSAWYSNETGLWPADEEVNDDGESCNVGWVTYWRPMPAPPAEYN